MDRMSNRSCFSETLVESAIEESIKKNWLKYYQGGATFVGEENSSWVTTCL